MQEARWYVVNVYSGFEKKVAEAIREQAERKGLSDRIEEILVPSEEVIQVKRGKKQAIEKNYFPGYLLIKMHLTDDTWHLVKGIHRVSGFLGAKGGKPTPISQHDVENILKQVQESIEKPRQVVSFTIGEAVRVCDGPFTSFTAVVDEVDTERSRLKVSVSIFGRPTPVDLEFSQVEKV